MERHEAESVTDHSVQVGLLLTGFLQKDVQHLLYVGNEGFFKDLCSFAIDLDVFLFLLGFHMIVCLA